MKNVFTKEAVGTALTLGLVIAVVLIVRDNMPKQSFKFMGA